MLEISRLSKRFEQDQPILREISLSIEQGEIVCLLGPSGCGKTTLLRIVAGLETADSGEIDYEGRNLATIPVHERNFGLMFQEFALFPHRTVGENIVFGLRMAKWTPTDIDARLIEMLDLIDLPLHYADRSIFELSGGERQRVALARSLAPGPKLLMLDEPLGNLDRALRESLMTELRVILKRLGVTVIYVTHDQGEAYAVADRIVLMDKGSIVQIGAPQTVYTRPATPFAARFLGFGNLIPAQVDVVDPLTVDTPIGRFELATGSSTKNSADQALLLIHPQAATLVDVGCNARADIAGQVERSSFRGDHFEIVVFVGGDLKDDGSTIAGEWGAGQSLVFELSTYALLNASGELDANRLTEGATVQLALNTRMMSLLDRTSLT
jgi:ABC-type Fe3+/spermidine/putrescine transport system ATPase subunit